MISDTTVINRPRPALVIGLNPALQRSITLSVLSVGSVNRGKSVKIGIGGKGQDVLVAAASMEVIPSPLLVGFQMNILCRLFEIVCPICTVLIFDGYEVV